MTNVASAHPSKAFFVEMLTRDIELRDAILDLLDNCIDGIQRHLKKEPPADVKKPFAGFRATLSVTKRRFEITDNCGGIPRSVAEKYAFRLGRPAGMRREALPTVGVYGIGMKRAIFKIGRSCTVTTIHSGEAFSVVISPTWMEEDDNWDLPITDLSRNAIPHELRADAGTRIEIDHLLPAISQEFDRQQSNFLDDLATTISTHYSYIIHKGFEVTLNGKKIGAKNLGLLVSPRKLPKDQRIEPFVYKVEHGALEIDLMVGLYRPLPSETEVERELAGESGTSSKELCGWTIICNDRVVLYGDKTLLTGWGEASVPSYHPQFIAIAGVVRFRSNDARLLPVTTTKRGIEASSETYLAVKDVMREGLKHFTNFTNRWKSRGAERIALMKAADSVDPFLVTSHLAKPRSQWTEVRKGLGGAKYVPPLPQPPKAPETTKAIRFTKPIKEYVAVAEYLFDDAQADPSLVGATCFDRVLRQSQR